MRKGDLAGHLRPDGYLQVKIDNKNYLSHRVIFMMFEGYLPDFLDHINLVKTDNRIENLRPSTITQNAYNCKSRKDSSSEYKGVYWNKINNNWRSTITTNGKKEELGSFTSEIDAAEAYNVAAIKYHGEFACLNIIPVPKGL